MISLQSAIHFKWPFEGQWKFVCVSMFLENVFISTEIVFWFADAPKILVDLMPARVTWALGYQEHLDCPVDANPPVREFSWKKNTYLVSFSSDHITLLSNGSLLVKSVQHSDAGAYSCMPVSSIGNGPSSPLMQVIVQGNDMLYMGFCQIWMMLWVHERLFVT